MILLIRFGILQIIGNDGAELHYGEKAMKNITHIYGTPATDGNIEIWDAYDAQENKLGYDLFRNEQVPDGVYHIAVEVYVFSRDGKVLITQRATNKTYPLKWENTGGSVLKGETPMQGAIRELNEETGLIVTETQLCLAYTEVKHPAIYKCFVAFVEENEQIRLQEGETVDYKWLLYDDLLEFIKTDEFVPKIRDSILQNIKSIDTVLALLKIKTEVST